MIERFINDEFGYLDWIGNNPQGFVVNCERNPTPAYLVLHIAICLTITGTPANGEYWTRDYIKVCSLSKEELDEWARKEVGGELHPCGICKP